MKCVPGKPHKLLVHLNTGKVGHVWLCLACRKQIAGPKIFSVEEIGALVDFVTLQSEDFKRAKAQKRGDEVGKISVTVEGENRVELVKALRAFADNLDGKPADKQGKVTKPQDDDETEEADEEEEIEADEEVEADEEAEVEEPPKKAAKKKPLTHEDVNAAWKKHAQKHGMDATKKIVKKFGVVKASQLDPKQFQKAIDAAAV